MAEHEHDEKSGGHGGGHGGHGAAHGGGGHEEHEGAPEWLISFADNVALLMGFFVILLAMNMAKPKMGGIGGEDKYPSPDSEQMMDLIIGIRRAFHSPIDMHSDDPAEAALREHIRNKSRRGSGDSKQPNQAGEGAESQANRPDEYSDFGGTVPFDDGAASLGANARAIAEKIGQDLKGMRWIIEVRGHTSPAEARGDFERANALSYRRATAVAQVLAAQGIKWEQMRLVACGDNERRVQRTYDDALLGLNQRVDVVVTGTPVAADTPAPPPVAAATEDR